MARQHPNANPPNARAADLAPSPAAAAGTPVGTSLDPAWRERRKADRRRTSALIALCVEVERRSGRDQRAASPPADGDVDGDT